MTIRPNCKEVILPGGIELAQEAEKHLRLNPSTHLLSVGCGTGELEIYFAFKYGCRVTGVDVREAFITRATEKALAWNLSDVARFEVGDACALRFEDSSFDVVFCSGALCAFFDSGLSEFRRVLKPGGTCAISDVIWRRDDVPAQVVQRWTRGVARVLTLEGHSAAFDQHRFRVLFSRAYHEPSWWESYYDDRSTVPNLIEERENYRQDQEYFGLGLFVVEKA